MVEVVVQRPLRADSPVAPLSLGLRHLLVDALLGPFPRGLIAAGRRRIHFRRSVVIHRGSPNLKVDTAGRSHALDLFARPTDQAAFELLLLEGVTLRDTVTGETRRLDVSGLFIAIGHYPRSELLTGQVDLDDEGYVLVQPGSTATNLPGVFACGDLVDHTYRQAITAAGSGCSAALDAERFLSH